MIGSVRAGGFMVADRDYVAVPVHSTFAVLGGGSAVGVTRRVAWGCVILG
jgi:hypothetical protein